MEIGRSWGISAVVLAATLLAAAMPPGGASGAQDDGTAAGYAGITFSAFACPMLPERDSTPVPAACTEPLPDATLTAGHQGTIIPGEDNTETTWLPVAPMELRVNHPRARAVTLDCRYPGGEPVGAERSSLGLFLYTYDERFHPTAFKDGSDLRCTAFVALAEDLGAAGAVLTVHNRTCPADYRGPDYYGVCHDTPTVNDQFILSGPTNRRGSTDVTGNLTLAALPPGRYELHGGLPGDFGHVVAFCARTATPGVRFPSTTERLTGGPGAYRTTLDLAAGDDITCDVYAIPADLSFADSLG